MPVAQFKRFEVAAAMYATGMVPVFYHADIEIAKQVVKACYDGGARVFEFTNRGDFAHEVFGQLVKYAKANLPGFILGVGTVLDAGTASIYLQMGANFVVSPALHPDVAAVCNRRQVLWGPGCGSVSEISQAQSLGAEVIKLFPGAVLGPGMVAATLAPMPWSQIMPTGGVEPTEANLSAWFKAGVFCVGMGSQLFPSDAIAAGNFGLVQQRVADALAIIKKLRP